MSEQSKAIFTVGGLVFCILFGWIMPFIILLYIFGLVVMYANRIDTKDRRADAPAGDRRDAIAEIEQAIINEPDEKVREGLEKALTIIGAKPKNSSGSPAPNQNATSMAASQPRIAPVQQVFESQYVELPVPAAPQPQPLSPEDVAAQTAKREQDNINTMLYVASFLLVGAAIIFIGTSLPAMAKFVGLLGVALAFYIVGLILHAKVIKLRPAATAFVGTGLALVPFVGLALYNYVLRDGALSWWLTSVVGLVMFFYALVVMRNTVLGYLTVAFVFSLTTSSVAVLSLPFVWYFVGIILVGSIVQYLSYKAPSWLPQELRKPLSDSGQLSVPLAAIGSVLAGERLKLFDYELVTGVASLHYGVRAYGLRQTQQYFAYFSVARILLIIFSVIVVYDIFDHRYAVAAVLVISAFLTQLYALKHRLDQYEIVWLGYAQAALGAAIFIILPEWRYVSVILVGLLLMSWWQLAVMKKEEYGLGGLLAISAIPYVICIHLLNLDRAYEILAITCVVSAIVLQILRFHLQNANEVYRRWLFFAYIILAIEAFIVSLYAQQMWYLAAGLVVSALVAQIYIMKHYDQKYSGQWLLAIQAMIGLGISLWWGEWQAMSVGLVALLLVSLWQMKATGLVAEGYSGYVALMSLPIIVCYKVLDIAQPAEVAGVVFLVMCVLMMLLRFLGRKRINLAIVRWLQLAYIMAMAGAVILAIVMNNSLLAACILGISAAIGYVSSHLENEPQMYMVANLLMIGGFWYGTSELTVETSWRILYITWVSAIIWYSAMWYLHLKRDEPRRDIMLYCTLSVLFLAAMLCFISSGEVVTAACLSACVGAGLLAIEGYQKRHQLAYYELAIAVVTLTLQRLLYEKAPGTDLLFYTHWWAFSLGLMALLRLRFGHKEDARSQGMLALAFISLPSGFRALNDPETYQLLFLVEHVLLLVAGFMTNKQYLVRWSAAFIAAAMLWMLRGYTYVLLGLLGIGLIALAVWRLLKRS